MRRSLDALVVTLALLAGVLATELAAAQAADPAQQRYLLHARLDAARHVVDGELELSLTNHASKALSELWLHLYPNAFADAGTVFMREGGARLRGQTLEREGKLELFELRTADGLDLLPTATSEVVAGDRTQLRVPLPAPLAPGARLVLHARFRTTLPSLLARSGFDGAFHMVAQWFPKLAYLAPDGRWISYPYHGLGEFHANFADYELVLDVPADHVIAAPGERLEARVQADRRLERYRATRVLDVAWASYPRFRRLTDASTTPVLEVFTPPGQLHGARQQLARLRGQITTLSRWLGPYPYGRFVLVLPPPGARGAAGMEYPGLVVGWDTPAGFWPGFPATLVREAVTAHELAHQWFSCVVANDEVAHPFLDEGLAEFVTNHLERERLGPGAGLARVLGLPIERFELLRVRMGMLGRAPSSLRRAPDYHSAGELAGAVYLRPALVLETLRRSWGADRLDAALADYARHHRFSHPAPEALYQAFDRAYWAGFARSVLEPALDGVGQDLRLVRHQLSRSGQTYRLEVELTRSSPLPLPSRVRVRDADGRRTDVEWPGRTRSLVFTHRSRAVPVSIEADPYAQNLLDPDRRNHGVRIGEPTLGSPLAWRVLGLAQAVLRALGP